MNNEKKYSVIDVTLHNLTTESIRMSENNREIYNKNLGKVLDSIINQMKNDEMFKHLYRTMEYSGSSYENLKISKPNKFDINLLFVWPAGACRVLYDSKQPGYVRLRIDLDNPSLKKIRDDVPIFDKKISKWIDKRGFFLRSAFKAWMQGIVTKAIFAASVEDTEIKLSASGSAITLKIQQHSENLKYSVDLVPAFVFNEKDWPSHPVRQLPVGIKNKEWFVVPKDPRSEDAPVYWRMTFYIQEKELMNDRGSMKHVIKLIKLLLNKENWSNYLFSYAIETVFLWECEKSPIDLWEKGVGTLFVYMLQKLSDDYLASGKIKYYWDTKLNLIEKIKESTRKIMKDRICVILKVVTSNTSKPNAIKAFFGVPEEKQPNSSEVSSTSLIDFIGDDTDCSSSSSVVGLSHSQCPLKTGTKPEVKKGNGYVHCIVEDNKCESDTRANIDSPPAIELLKIILKEQEEMKGMLQSLLLQCRELSQEVKVLRKESTLKQELQDSKNVSKTNSSIESNSFKDLKISCTSDFQKSCDISPISAFQQNSSSVPNVFTNKNASSRSDKDFEFSNLLPSSFHQK